MIQSGCTRRQVGLAATNTGKGPKLGVSRSLLQQRGRHIGPKGLVRRDVQVRVADLDSEALFPVYYDSEKEQSRKYRRTVSLLPAHCPCRSLNLSMHRTLKTPHLNVNQSRNS